MIPAEITLALRAIAAGAPPVRRAAALSRRVAGQRHRCPESGLAYIVAEISRGGQLPLPEHVPDLSDPSWIGWTLAEVQRRGYWWCLSSRGTWGISGPRVISDDATDDIPATLVAMLEATRPS